MESNVSIYLNHFTWAPYFKEGKRQLGLGLEEIGDELMLMDAFPRPLFAKEGLAWRGRLIHRLMQALPWQTHGEALWVDGDPALRHQQWGGPGFELRVPASRLDEVMRVLLPLVRQLRAHVMVPSRRFWFISWTTVSPDSEAQLNAWDPAWQTPPMKGAARRSMVIAGLKARLEPLGFAFASESEESFRFTRPLKLGGGYQIVKAALNFRLGLKVLSERDLQMAIERGTVPEGTTLDCKSPNGMVVLQDMERVSDYPFDTIAYQEDAAWYFEEFDRLFLPALDHLQSAKALYEWYWDERWRPYNSDQKGRLSVYAARFLPDAEFFPIVDGFVAKYPKGGPAVFARFMRTQPMFSDERL
jgi:hypothetical protein